MEMKEYVITCKSYAVLQSLYNDMETEGGTLYIPNRAVEVTNRREVSRNTHYKLTEEEAELIRHDKRVIACELTIEERPNVEPVFYGYTNNMPYGVGVDFTKGYASVQRMNDRQWGHLHSAGTTAQRRKGTWGSGTQVQDNVDIYNDGRHVDVVIVDGECAFDSDEWKSLSTPQPGIGNRFVPYDWFGEHPNVGVTGNYAYPSMTGTGMHDHGMHVGGTVAGQYYGWAPEANIYGLNFMGNYSIYYLFDFIREFHKKKPINGVTGRKNPTICNNSWGFRDTSDWTINNVTSVTYRGTTYDANNPGPSGWSMYGLHKDFGIADSGAWPIREAAVDADIEDAIAEGVVVVAAAGNSNHYCVREGHPDYDNRATISGIGTNTPMHRGPTPGATKGVICVGALNTTDNFTRATFTNYGDRIDVFAPGVNILSVGGDGGYAGTAALKGPITRPEYPNNFDNMLTFSGTSMASPQVTGILACAASGRERFTQDDAIGYVRNMSLDGDMTFDTASGTQGSTWVIYIDEPNTNTQNYTIDAGRSNDRNGNVGGQDPTITIHPGDLLAFELPQYETTGSIDAANTSQGYQMTINGAQSWNPTITVDSGDIISLQLYTSLGTHPIYFRDSNGNDITTGVTNQGASAQWDYFKWDTTGVPAGNYKYQCGSHPGMQGTITINAERPWNHPMHIEDSNGNIVQSNIVRSPLDARGSTERMIWTTSYLQNGTTYYYQCGNHGQMRGIIDIVNTGAQAPGGHRDNTCQQGSPNREIRCVNPRPTTGYVSGWKQSTLNGRRRTDREDDYANQNRQLYPRVNGFYKP
jgi:plastocyanin